MRIRIGTEKGRMPAGWERVSIEQAVWLQKRVKQLPSDVVAYYESLIRTRAVPLNSLTDAATQEWVRFARETLCRLCGMTPFGVGKASEEDLLRIAQNFLPLFVLGVLGYADAEFQPRKSFRFGRKTYFFPVSGRDISGGRVPFAGMTAIEFCTVSDLISLDDLSVAPVIVATCCRRKGERYDERTIPARSEAFARLPMSVYWHIWAAMNAVHEYMKAECPDCFHGTGGKEGEHSGSVSWVNTLLQLVADKPSELEYVQSMPCYDFIRLLSVSIEKQREEWKIRSALRF